MKAPESKEKTVSERMVVIKELLVNNRPTETRRSSARAENGKRKDIDDSNLPYRVGKTVKFLRFVSGVSQVALGRDTRLSQSFISDLENGKVDAKLTDLQKLARVFELESWQLLKIAEEPPNDPASLLGMAYEWMRPPGSRQESRASS